LEFLGKSGDVDKLQQALGVNGSLGNSPATTAYYLLLVQEDERALAYLESIRAHKEHIIYLYPFRVFELSWVLNNLTFSSLPITEFAGEEAWESLQSMLTPKGAGLDPSFGIPDGDITSACCRVLLEAGCEVDPLILAQYENEEEHIFHTYEYERNVSVSTNAHAMEALQLMPNYPDCRRTREQIAIMLLDNREYDTYWTDKWHASPYYATAHALVALLREKSYLAYACQHTVEWLLHTQRDDGSWGFYDQSTAEETAYALTALLHYNQHERIDQDVLHQGAAYLVHNYQENNISYPEFWIGKDLFVPYEVVRSAILATLILYEEIFGCPL
jgi:halimadienyl-diphosphate synthase